MRLIGGLIALMYVLSMVVLGLGSVALTIYGLYLAFSASLVLGLLALVFEPSPLLFGVVMFFWGQNLPELILKALNQ